MPALVVSTLHLAAAIRLVRAEETWEPVIFGAMIPFGGALAVGLIIWRAVKSNPENDPPEDEREDEK